VTDLWMPGATKHDVGDHAATDHNYPAKAIAHITWDKNATAAKPIDLVPYENLVAYFSGAGVDVAPTVLWDPFTGRVTQFYPADSRSKSVVDLSGGTRTNRAGKVVIQVEALFFPYCRVGGKVYAKLSDTPCKGWSELHAWIKSLGVPDVWPMGKPVDFTSHRDEHAWETQGGWYGHSQVPENTHQDPGSWPAFPAAPKPPSGTGSTSAPLPQPVAPTFPGRNYFTLGAKNKYALQLQTWLSQIDKKIPGSVGPAYLVGPSDKMTQKDLNKVKAFQQHFVRDLGPADGLAGPKTWQYLWAVATGHKSW